MSNRKHGRRDYRLEVWVAQDEYEKICEKMNQNGIVNMSAFIRKMVLDGYVIQLDLPELKELLFLLRRSSNNLNQLTRRVNATGHIYKSELEDLKRTQEKLWDESREIIKKLSMLI